VSLSSYALPARFPISRGPYVSAQAPPLAVVTSGACRQLHQPNVSGRVGNLCYMKKKMTKNVEYSFIVQMLNLVCFSAESCFLYWAWWALKLCCFLCLTNHPWNKLIGRSASESEGGRRDGMPSAVGEQIQVSIQLTRFWPMRRQHLISLDRWHGSIDECQHYTLGKDIDTECHN
jgi:hypothetical protein